MCRFKKSGTAQKSENANPVAKFGNVNPVPEIGYRISENSPNRIKVRETISIGRHRIIPRRNTRFGNRKTNSVTKITRIRVCRMAKM